MITSHTSSVLPCPSTMLHLPGPALPYNLNLLGQTVIALNQTQTPHTDWRS
jgi:hypothetical protein